MRFNHIVVFIVLLCTNHPTVGDGFVDARGRVGEGQPVRGSSRKLLTASRCPSSIGSMFRWSSSLFAGANIHKMGLFDDEGSQSIEDLQRRRLLQSPSTTTIVPVGATAPSPEGSPISPFAPSSGMTGNSTGNATSGNGSVCCCNGNGQIVQIPYQQPTPPGCCCGDPSYCCPSGNLVVLMCGGGTVCIVLMLLSVFAAIAILTLCTLGAFISHRRRRRAAALAAANAEGGEGNQREGALGVDSLRISRSRLPNITIPADQVDSLRVRPPLPEEQGCNKECPICLESIAIEKNNWVVMPCSHGCCKPCLGDLLRLSSRAVNADTRAFLCPLCRKLAAADRERRENETGGNVSADEPAAAQEEPAAVNQGQQRDG
jgi:hypothetical protein